MPTANAPGFAANGNVTPSRFVKIDTTIDGRVLQAGAGDPAFGVSGQSTRYPPYSTLNDGFHAIAGEPCHVFQMGETAMLECGAAVTRGDRLKSDATGRGITAAAGDPSYARAIQSGGAAGVFIEVQVERDTIGAS